MNNSVSKKMMLNSLAMYAKLFISVITSFLSVRLIVKYLGASDFGVYNVIGGVIVLFSFASIAMAQSNQRFLSIAMGKKDQEEVRDIFYSTLTVHFFLSIIVGLVLIVMGLFMFDHFLQIDPVRVPIAKIIYFYIAFLSVLTTLFVPYESMLVSNEDFIFTAIIYTIESTLKLGIAFLLCYVSIDKLLFYGIALNSVYLFFVFFRVAYCIKKYPNIKLKNYSFRKTKCIEIAKFSLWNSIESISTIIKNQGVVMAVNVFCGTVVNAAYAIGVQLSNLFMMFSSSIMSVVSPQIIKNEGGGDRCRMIELSLFASKVSYTILAMVVFSIIINMDTLLNLWLGEVPMYTTSITIVLLVVLLLAQLSQPFHTVILAIGRIRKYQFFVGIIQLISVGLVTLALFFKIEVYFALLFFLFGEIAIFSFRLSLVNLIDEFSIKQYLSTFLFPLFLCSLSSFLLVFLVGTCFDSFFKVIITSILTMSLLGISYWFFYSDARERAVISSFFRKQK